MARTATASATLDELADTLSHNPRLVDQRGRHLALAPEVVQAFQHAIAELQSPDTELTTEAAATLLGISRPTLIRLLDTGAIPYRRTQGTRGIAGSVEATLSRICALILNSDARRSTSLLLTQRRSGSSTRDRRSLCGSKTAAPSRCRRAVPDPYLRLHPYGRQS